MKTIILDTTDKYIEVVLSSAKVTADCDVVAAWADNSAANFSEGSGDAQTNGITPVTVVAAPAALTRRIIKSMSICNNDSVPVTVTVRLVSGGNNRVIAKVTLAERDTWTLEGTFNQSGSLKGIGADGINGREVEFQTSPTTGIIQWRYVDEPDWIDLDHDHDVGDLVQIFQNGLV